MSTSQHDKHLVAALSKAQRLDEEITTLDAEARHHGEMSRNAAIKANAKKTELQEINKDIVSLRQAIADAPAPVKAVASK